jgi:hypothetical protein
VAMTVVHGREVEDRLARRILQQPVAESEYEP